MAGPTCGQRPEGGTRHISLLKLKLRSFDSLIKTGLDCSLHSCPVSPRSSGLPGHTASQALLILWEASGRSDQGLGKLLITGFWSLIADNVFNLGLEPGPPGVSAAVVLNRVQVDLAQTGTAPPALASRCNVSKVLKFSSAMYHLRDFPHS